MLQLSNSNITITDPNGNIKFNSSLNMPKLASTYYSSVSIGNIGVNVQVTEIVNGSPAGFAAVYANSSMTVYRPSYSNVQYGNRFAVVYVKSNNSLLGHPTEYTLCNGSIPLDFINTPVISTVTRKDNNGTAGARILHTNIQNGFITIRVQTMFNTKFGGILLYGVNGIDSFPPNNITNSSMTTSYSRNLEGHYGIALTTSGSAADSYNSNPYWEFLNTNTTLTFMIKEYVW